MELTRVYDRAMIFNYFKVVLDQEECLQRLQLAYGDEIPSHATA